MTVTDPDTGERRIVVDRLVDEIVWWLDGPYADPPPSIRDLTDAQRHEVWQRIDRLARHSGEAALRGLAEQATARYRHRRSDSG